MNQTEFHQVPLKKMAPIALFNDIHYTNNKFISHLIKTTDGIEFHQIL